MNDLLVNPAFTALLAACVGAGVGYLSKRTETAPGIQNSITAAVAGIMGHYEKSLAASMVQIEAMRAEIGSLRNTVEAQSTVIGDLETHIDNLTDAMVRAGVKPPTRNRSPT
jgi:hypothetical protein